RWLLVVMILLAVGVSLAGWLWVRGGLPTRDGSHVLDGLDAEVRVRFDAWGVPHVEADTERDLFAALGWLHANDRMTQMELGRRAAAGRLAEVIGADAVPTDEYFRRLDFRRAIDRLLDDASPEAMMWLEAYASGVNAWLDTRGSDLPPGLRLLGGDLEPWAPRDSLGFALLMARDLSFFDDRPEEKRFQWLRALGDESVRDLLGKDGLGEDVHIAEGLLAPAPPPAVPDEGATSSPGPPSLDSPGSNNWALGPGRTASGGALIANDPHLGLYLPSAWYQALLRSPDLEIAGMTLPGVPGVVIGRGRHVAWVFTNTMLDDHDLFFEEVDGDRVRRGDAWVPLEVERQEIQVKGAEPHEVVVRRSNHGVLLDADEEEGLPPRSLAWTAHLGGDPVGVMRRLALARNADEVLAAVDAWVCPAQNLVVALEDGTLLFTVLGRVPARRIGDGRLPSPGWDPAYGWDGLRPWDTNPIQVVDDPSGVIVTANDDIRPDDYALPLVAEFFPGHRARRIEQRLATTDAWDVESVAALQMDVVSLYAREVIEALSGERLKGDAAEVYAHLAAWDGTLAIEGPSALWALVEDQLLRAIFTDEARLHGVPDPGDRERLLWLLRGQLDQSWFDNVETPETEDRLTTIAAALDTAWHIGRSRWGDDVASWRYGEYHPLTLRHRLDAAPGIGLWLRRGPYPMPGAGNTIAAAGGDVDGEQRPVTWGASMRWVFDWGQPDQAWAVLPGGQSGHGADPHYDDQISLFLDGELHPAPWSDAAIREATVSELVLRPQESP
ncbi:MAG: penicillin acylase family protein, partial [Acidobacteriota bacterium]